MPESPLGSRDVNCVYYAFDACPGYPGCDGSCRRGIYIIMQDYAHTMIGSVPTGVASDGKLHCDICGAEIVDPESGEYLCGGLRYCESCASDRLWTCNNCEQVYDYSDEEPTEIGHDYLCADCRDDNYFVCADCGEWSHNDNAVESEDGDICQSCYENHYFVCADCRDVVHNNDAFYDEESCEYYCEECYQEIQSRQSHGINGYDYKPKNYTFFEMPDEDRSIYAYYGIEIETDRDPDSSTKSDPGALSKWIVKNHSNCLYCKRDGSLTDGVEVVTQPCTLRYHQHHMRDVYIALARAATSNDLSSHNTNTCGLHVHVSRQNWSQQSIASLVYLYHRHWRQMLRFSRRTQEQIDNWAAKYNIDVDDDQLDIISKCNSDYSKYRCVNLTNRDTIEIRIFRGSLNVETILASIEQVALFTEIARKYSFSDIYEFTWIDIKKMAESFGNYQNFLSYCTRRGI